MKVLTLYIDKWYIIGAVCIDGVPRLVIPENKEDRYWLYFYEDTTNNEIVYGKDNQSHYRNNEPHYYGDVFSKMTQGDSHFLYYNRKQELCDIFKNSRILASLREAMDSTESEDVETYVSFSKDISDDARYLFLTKVLGQNHFHVREFAACIEHLTLEHSFRNNKLKDDGFILVLNACNENLHVSLFKKQGKFCVLQSDVALVGYGRDLRSKALLEYVVARVNQRTNFLSSSDFEKEYQRLEPEVDYWLVRLDNAKSGRPVCIDDVSFSGMENQYSVTVLKNDIDSRTHVVVENVVREIDGFVKKSKVNNNEVKGIVFLGNTFTNKQFLESIHSYYILGDENYLFYRETELPDIIGVYSVIDCSQFSVETKAIMSNGELELERKQRAKEEKDRMDEAKRKNQELQEKAKEAREAELRYKEAMDNVASFERKQNYAQMLDWANIALTHRADDKEAMSKKEEATRLLSEQKVRQQQYNSIIQRAEASLKEHEYQDALSQSDAALNLMPSSEQAKLIHDKARKALDDIAQVKEYLTRADLFLAQKSYNEALEELRKVLSFDEHNEVALHKTSEIQVELKKQNQRIESLKQIVNHQKENNEDFEESIVACNELLSIDVNNQKQWTECLAQLKSDRMKFRENEQQWKKLNEQIHKALFDEDWNKVVELSEKALSIKNDDALRNNMQVAKEKLSKSQKETLFKQQINEVKALLVDKEFDEAKKMLSAMQREFDGHSVEMRLLFKQIFDEENDKEFVKKKVEEDFFSSSTNKKAKSNMRKSKPLDDDFFGSDFSVENRNDKSKVTNDDFDF